VREVTSMRVVVEDAAFAGFRVFFVPLVPPDPPPLLLSSPSARATALLVADCSLGASFFCYAVTNAADCCSIESGAGDGDGDGDGVGAGEGGCCFASAMNADIVTSASSNCWVFSVIFSRALQAVSSQICLD
jgi:hypothetical protein